MTNHWIGVASAEHVRRGRSGGFMQLGHGEAAPLKRVKPGDRIVYYSPTVVLGKKDGLQAFTAIGTVKAGEPYVADMGKGFKPYRRDVNWAKAKEAPIHPLLDDLEFTAGNKNLGLQVSFRVVSNQRGGFSVNRKGDGRGALRIGALVQKLLHRLE